MGKQIQMTKPDYKQIFLDIIEKKFPEKKIVCSRLLIKNDLSALEILEMNNLIFSKPDRQLKKFNKRYRSYCKSDIVEILNYQKKHKLNNSQLAVRFGLSRNTVAKWKKLF